MRLRFDSEQVDLEGDEKASRRSKNRDGLGSAPSDPGLLVERFFLRSLPSDDSPKGRGFEEHPRTPANDTPRIHGYRRDEKRLISGSKGDGYPLSIVPILGLFLERDARHSMPGTIEKTKRRPYMYMIPGKIAKWRIAWRSADCRESTRGSRLRGRGRPPPRGADRRPSDAFPGARRRSGRALTLHSRLDALKMHSKGDERRGRGFRLDLDLVVRSLPHRYLA